MAVSDYIDDVEQEPSKSVKYGSNWIGNIRSIEHESAYDQLIGTCTILLASAPTFVIVPNLITLIKVYEGYYDENVATFTGYVTDFKKGRFPNTWEITCQDVLRLAQETFLDDEGQEFTSTQAEDAVETLLGLAGLSVTAATTSFTIGDANPTKFKVVSVLEACKQIADLIGWRIWAGPDGTVYFQYQRPLPAASSIWSYPKSKIINYVHDLTDRNLRNRIVVIGYDTIRSVAFGDSPHVPTPPQYRTAVYSTEMVDTEDMADTIAARMYEDLNHLQRSIEMKVVGNPLVNVGNTIEISDNENGISGRWFVFRRHSSNNGDDSGYTMDFTAIAKDEADSPINFEPDPPEEPPEEPPPDPGEIPNTGDGSREYIATDVGMAYTDTFLEVSPTWFATNDGLTGDALNIFNFLPDPYSSDETSFTQMFMICTDGVYKNSALPDGTWEQVLSPAALEALIGSNYAGDDPCQFTREMVMPINAEGYIGFIAQKSVAGDFVGHSPRRYCWVWSDDFGVTWQAATDYWLKSNGGANASGYSGSFYAYASAKVAGRMYMSTINFYDWAGSRSDSARLYQSDDYGATWVLKNDWGFASRAYYLHFPYADALGGVYDRDIACYRSYTERHEVSEVQRTLSFPEPVYPTDWEDLETTFEDTETSSFMDTCTWNSGFIYILVRSIGTGLVVSNDGETFVRSVPDTLGENAIFSALSCLPSNAQFCVIANVASSGNGRTYLTFDGGVTWDNQTGDLNTALPGITAVRRIIPDSVRVS